MTEITIDGEVYRQMPIRQLSNYYLSKSGKLYNKARERFLKVHNDNTGADMKPNTINIPQFVLSEIGGTERHIPLAKALAYTWVDFPQGYNAQSVYDKKQILFLQHRDSNCLNNEISNLYWSCRRLTEAHIAAKKGINIGNDNAKNRSGGNNRPTYLYQFDNVLYTLKDVADITGLSKSGITEGFRKGCGYARSGEIIRVERNKLLSYLQQHPEVSVYAPPKKENNDNDIE